jgi:inorganic triphosphatase YgiF
MAFEVELKFRIPAQRLAAVRQAVNTATARPLRLAARYVDTPGQDLARARTALRLRLEGDQWVQTLKAEGAGPLQRHEHEVLLPPGAAPLIDLARHDGSAAGKALRRLLAAAGDPPLVERYATDVLRTRRLLRSGGALIELALDEGELLADGGQRRQPICELEMELKQGTPAALLALAARWVQRFGLVLDVRSKSERGHLLAAGQAFSPAARLRPLVLADGIGAPQALSAMLQAALQPVLGNASVLAEGPAEAEHLHQLRVSLRRLRSLLRLYGPQAPQWPQAWSVALGALFAGLGEARDRDAAADGLWPALRAAGAPLVDWPAAPPGPPLAERLATPALQQLWLALLAASLPVDAPALAADASAEAEPTPRALARPLDKLWRLVQRDARRFDRLSDDARHRLRRRIKRLRYALELAGSQWPARRVDRMLRQLTKAQAPLGDFNDTLVALARYRHWADEAPQAWFAVGWLSARRDALLPDCARALARLADCPVAWKPA